MTTVATAQVLLIPSFGGNGNLSRSIGSALTGAYASTNGTSKAAGEKSSSLFGAGFLKGGAVAGAAASVVTSAMNMMSNSIGSAISRVDTMNNFPRVMKNLGYSADDASSSIQTMSDRLTGLPTSLDSMTSTVQQLAPLTSGLEEATNISLALNDALLASGSSTSDVSRAMIQYTQMLGKGSVDLQSWRTLQEVMPGQLNQIAKALLGASASSSDLYQAMQNGTVSFQDFNNAMLQLDSEGINGFASFKQQAFDATGGIATAFANLQTAITRSLANIVQAIGASTIAGVITSIGTSVTNAGNVIVGVIESAKAQIDVAGFTDAFARIGDAVSNLVSHFSGFDTAVGSSIGSAINLLIPAFDAIASAIEFVANNFDTLAPILTAAASGFLGFTKVIPAVTGIASTVSGGITAIKEFGATASLMGDSLGALFSSGGIKALPKFFAGIASPVGIAVVAITAIIGALVALYNTNEDFRNFVNGIGEAILSIPGQIAGVFDSIVLGAQSMASSIGNFFTVDIPNAFNAFVNFITVEIPNAVMGGIQAIGAFFGQLPYLIGFAIGSAIGFVVQFGLSLFNFYTVTVPEFFMGVITWFTQLPENIWNAIVGAVTNLISWGTEMANAGINAAVQLVSNVSSFMSQLPGQVWAAICSVPGKISQMGSQMLSNAQSAAAEVVGGIINAFSALPGQVAQIGGNIAQGLWNGISGLKDWVISQVASMGQGIIDGLCNVLGIHSPSRVMAQIGVYTMQGLALGIDDSAKWAIKSAESAVSDVVKAASGVTVAPSSIAYDESYSNNSDVVAVLDRLENNLGQIIAKYAPVSDMSDRERARYNKKIAGLI